MHWRRKVGDHDARVDSVEQQGSRTVISFSWADRENKRVSDRFDPLGAAGLRALRAIIEEAGKADCPVTVCGEMGGSRSRHWR